MGLDLYIEARIREKKTGRLISSDIYEKYADEEDKGFFEICWWCSSDFSDIREKMIEIINKYNKTNYTNSDYIIPIPQPALRDIYACIISRSYLTDNEYLLPFNEWIDRNSYEKANLLNADKLHNFLWILDSIKYENDIYIDCIEKEYIPNHMDFESLHKNPQAYEWEFRILNSY